MALVKDATLVIPALRLLIEAGGIRLHSVLTGFTVSPQAYTMPMAAKIDSQQRIIDRLQQIIDRQQERNVKLKGEDNSFP